MPGIDPKAARTTWTAALTLLLLAAIYEIRGTLFLFAVALLFACLLYPLVNQISARFSPKNRTPALVLTYLVLIGLLTTLLVVVGSQVAAQAKQLIAQPPDIRGFLSRLEQSYPILAPSVQAAEGHLRGQLGEFTSAVPRFGLRMLAASTNLIDLVVIPILSFFMLKDAARLRDGFLETFPSGAQRARARRTIDEIQEMLLQYTRALLWLCSTVLVVFSIVLSALGVQYALLLSAAAFFCEFVPVVGPLTAMAVILAVTALTGYSHLWWIVAFLGGFRILQDYVISPKLMSRGVELHPIWVIFGVFAGAEIAGVPGVFLSVPVLALARVLMDELVLKSTGTLTRKN